VGTQFNGLYFGALPETKHDGTGSTLRCALARDEVRTLAVFLRRILIFYLNLPTQEVGCDFLIIQQKPGPAKRGALSWCDGRKRGVSTRPLTQDNVS